MKKAVVVALLLTIPFFYFSSSSSSATPLPVSSENRLPATGHSGIGGNAQSAVLSDSGTYQVFLPIVSNHFFSCDHLIEQGISTADGRTNYSGVKAGDTVCIAAGTRGDLKLANFQGSAQNPITFINYGGQVVIDSDTSHGILFQNSSFFRLTGTGDPKIEYGFKIINSTNVGVQAAYKSSNLEIDHIEVSGVKGAGIMSKDKALCSDGSGNNHDYDGDGIIQGDLDDVVNRDNFTQYNSVFHDNYIHDVGTEGFYIGSSFYEGREASCNSGTETLYAPVLRGVRVYNNKVTGAGWDGLQVGSATENCNIHHNEILRDSQANELYQESGMMIAHGSVCNVYNNYIKDGGGPGIFVQGNGGNIIYNNVIVNAGQNQPLGNNGGDGITVFGTSGNGISILNNTIVMPRNFGIKFENSRELDRIQNNIVVAPDNYDSYEDEAYIQTWGRFTGVISHNHTSQNLEGVRFAEPGAGDFSLNADSPAIDAGINWELGVDTADYVGTARPQGKSYDVGAYEHVP